MTCRAVLMCRTRIANILHATYIKDMSSLGVQTERYMYPISAALQCVPTSNLRHYHNTNWKCYYIWIVICHEPHKHLTTKAYRSNIISGLMNESSPSGFYKMMDIPKSEEDFQVSGTHMMQVVPRA
jgi:hypothetical protein